MIDATIQNNPAGLSEAALVQLIADYENNPKEAARVARYRVQLANMQGGGELWRQMLAHLHRGGQYANWWTLRTKTTTWWTVGDPAPLPETKNIYFSIHPLARIPEEPETDKENKPITDPMGNIVMKLPRKVRSRNDCIAAINCLFSEFDQDKGATYDTIKKLRPKPSEVIASGGGWHVYWLLDEPFEIKSEQDREHARRIQAAWVEYTGGDDGAKDLARILRVPGTMNAKYDPPRPVQFVLSDLNRTYKLADLVKFLPAEKPHQAAAAPAAAAPNPNGHHNYSAEEHLQRALARAVADNNRNNTGIWLSTQMRDDGYTPDEIMAIEYPERAPAGDTAYTRQEWERTVKSAFTREPRDPPNRMRWPWEEDEDEQPQAEPAQEGEQDLQRYLLQLPADHDGHASCLIKLYPNQFLYCDAYGWLYNTGTHWERECAEERLEAIIIRTLKRRRFAAMKTNPVLEPLVRATAGSAHNINGIKVPLRSKLVTSVNVFDADPDLLNVKNGVIHLPSGTLAPHQPDQRFTYCLPVDYDTDADADLWLNFLFEAVNYNGDFINYIQEAVGYTLTGHTWEEVLFYLFGVTRSGKGTFTETLLYMMGGKPLATEVDFTTFTAQRSGDDQNFDLAPLKPCRFVAASESNKNIPLNPAKVKHLTGGNYVYCAFKHRDHFSYRPQFKIWLSSNFPANVDVDDDAAWARVRVIEFPNSHLGHEDKSLKRDLKQPENLRGVLRWAVEGARIWYSHGRQGLPYPPAIKTATDKQRGDQDYTQSFIDECCEPDPERFIASKTLYTVYENWCKDMGVTPKHHRAFSQALKRKGYEDTRRLSLGRLTRGFVGLRLAGTTEAGD